MALASVLIAAQLYERSLFHFLAETFNTAVVILVAVVGWQSYNFSQNRYVTYIAAGYFWVALLDIAHAVTYEGMEVVPRELSNFSIQLSLVSTFLEAALLVSAPVFSRYLGRMTVFVVFGAAAISLALSVLGGYFPTAYTSDGGPTTFTNAVEYVAILMFLLATVVLQVRRERLEKHLIDRMTLAMVLLAGAEFAITNYSELWEWPIVVGHFVRFIAYWIIYTVIVRMTLTEPFRVLAMDASTFDAVPDPTVIVDELGVIRSANRAARACLCDHDNFIGQHCHALLHSAHLPQEECPVCSALLTGAAAFELEVELKSRGQSHHISLSPISPGDPTAGTVHVSRNITQRKRLEAALRESETRFRGLVENTSDWVWEVNEAGYFTYVSPRAVGLLGYASGEMAGRRLFDFTDPTDATRLEQTLSLCGREVIPFKALENTFVAKDGAHVVMETTGAPFFAEDGSLAGFRGISRDITARKRTEQALARSEYTYRTLVENLPQYVFLKDTDSHLISCNRNFASLFDATPEMLVGKSMQDLHGRELAERFSEEDARIVERGRLEESVGTYVLRGKRMVLHTIKSPVVDACGSVVGLLGIFWDITERMQAEEALRESELRYKAILTNAGDAIIVGDSQGRFIDANPRAEALLGYSREELLQLTMLDIHPPEDHEVLIAALKQMNEHGSSLVEHRVVRKDGKIIDAEVSGTRISLGESFIYLGNFRDIRDRKRVEAELRSYREHLEFLVEERTRELRVSNAELEAFSYSVSHDLRSPLRAINGYGEALREELAPHLSAEADYYIDRMRAATNRMGELIDGLLNLSQVIRREFRISEVDLSALAGSIAASLLESASERTVKFKIDRDLRALGDETLLRVLLENLLNNAWKFTAKRDDACIEFGREMKEEVEQFFVRDNGAGFDMQFAHKLFQPFERLHGHGEFEGTGIGLATVRRIVERHGGRVWAMAGLGEGACIYFSLGTWED